MTYQCIKFGKEIWNGFQVLLRKRHLTRTVGLIGHISILIIPPPLPKILRGIKMIYLSMVTIDYLCDVIIKSTKVISSASDLPF